MARDQKPLPPPHIHLLGVNRLEAAVSQLQNVCRCLMVENTQLNSAMGQLMQLLPGRAGGGLPVATNDPFRGSNLSLVSNSTVNAARGMPAPYHHHPVPAPVAVHSPQLQQGSDHVQVSWEG